MIKSTPDVSTCFVFKSFPEAYISPLFFKNSFTLGGGNAPSQIFPISGAMLPHIIWRALEFLPSYAPVYLAVCVRTESGHTSVAKTYFILTKFKNYTLFILFSVIYLKNIIG